MSNEYSTAILLGAKAPFILIMSLSRFERECFVKTVTPNILPAFKDVLLKNQKGA